MIDRQAIASEVRGWAEELTGLGFHRGDASLWENGAPEPLRAYTARGVATKVRRKPKVVIVSLSPLALRCERILNKVALWDHRYRTALILYSTAPTITTAAEVMRRNAVDFGRFAEAGIALYAAYAGHKPY